MTETLTEPEVPGFCPGCGRPGSPHPRCTAALDLEPPRFCAVCGRRMVVQVRPDGWWARCSRHGTTDSGALAQRR